MLIGDTSDGVNQPPSIVMLAELKLRQTQGDPIRVGLAGAGAMGCGIALQVAQTPGMELAFIVDRKEEAIQAALNATGCENKGVVTHSDPLQAMDLVDGFDVFVESTNSIAPAYRFCEAAMQRGAHVVLMNAEVDLAFGPLLQKLAHENGVVCTSDAGDQHGVLMTMIEEIQLWGFRLVQAGNIKGFLNRYATAEDLAHEAAIRHLDPVQCCAYTDGSKLNIEMAVMANGTGLVPSVRGMEGPRADTVQEALSKFDLENLPSEGSVDYILGAEPGGGVYVIGHCDNPLQQQYLEYYKMGDGPFYLFYRPYHLCHLETTRAIALAALRGQAILRPLGRPIADVYAFAKRDLNKGDTVVHGIGGDEVYGLIDHVKVGEAERLLPIWLFEGESDKTPTLINEVAKDAPVTLADISIPDTDIHRLWKEQCVLLEDPASLAFLDRG